MVHSGLLRGDGEVAVRHRAVRPAYGIVSMTVTLFHLAIISKQPGCVKIFMKQFVKELNESIKMCDHNECSGTSMMEKVLRAKVEIDFHDEDMNSFDKDDRSLDGMTALHLAAKNDPDSLFVILRCLKECKGSKLQ